MWNRLSQLEGESTPNLQMRRLILRWELRPLSCSPCLVPPLTDTDSFWGLCTVTGHAVLSTCPFSASLGLTNWVGRSLRPWKVVGRAPNAKKDRWALLLGKFKVETTSSSR